jgi:hypothetical protein
VGNISFGSNTKITDLIQPKLNVGQTMPYKNSPKMKL